jgi:site-specific recombinase XerD
VEIEQAACKVKRDYTLLEWVDEWLKTYKADNLRQSTIMGLKSDIKHLKNLYYKPINQITNVMLMQAINEIESNRAKDKAHNLLKQLFTTARNNNLIEINPTANITRPKQFAKNERQALTQAQEKRFIEVCLSNLQDYEPFLILITTLCELTRVTANGSKTIYGQKTKPASVKSLCLI